MQSNNFLSLSLRGLMLPLLFLLGAQNGFSQCIIDVDFNSQSGTYTVQDAKDDFNNKIKPWTASTYRGLPGPGAATNLISPTPQNNQVVNGELRAEYTPNTVGGYQGGILFDPYFDGVEEAYLQYRVKFKDGFVWAAGGKLPGLGGSTRGINSETSGRGAIPSGGAYNDDGFSARLMWRRNLNNNNHNVPVPTSNNEPRLILYSYFAERSNGDTRQNGATGGPYGDGYTLFSNLQDDTWYTIKQYIKLNTPGQDNGTVSIWINGTRTFHKTDANIRKSGKGNVKINALIINTYRGGRNAQAWWSPQTDYAYFDDFKVWTGSSSTPPCSGGGGGTQSAYNGPHNIPGQLEAERYDNGGQGVAYNDSNTTNSGGQNRTNEGVDVANTSDTGGGQEVGWTRDGEWLEYTMANVQSGTYDITFRVSSNVTSTKSINARLDGANLGTISIPNTGGWSSYQNRTLSNVSISGGSNKVFRMNINGGSFNINHVTFTRLNTGATPDVASVTVSDDVTRGGTANVAVTYSAGNNQDVWVNFQLDQSPWTSYSSARINALPGANNTVTIPVSIPSNTPIANNAYQFQVVVAPDGGEWNERLANLARNDVDVVAGSSSLEGTYRLVNVRSGRYLDSDNVTIKTNTSASGSDKQWEIVNSAGSNYNIDSKFSGRGVIEAVGGGSVQGTSVQPVSTTNRREWTFQNMGNGEYLIKNVDTDGWLSEANPNGTDVVEWQTGWDGGRARWTLEPVGGSSRLSGDEGQSGEGVIEGVGVAPELTEQLSIFPNPAKDQLYIRGLASGTTQIEVYSITGELLIQRIVLDEINLSLNVASLKAGTYLVKVTGEEAPRSLKFVKQ